MMAMPKFSNLTLGNHVIVYALVVIVSDFLLFAAAEHISFSWARRLSINALGEAHALEEKRRNVALSIRSSFDFLFHIFFMILFFFQGYLAIVLLFRPNARDQGYRTMNR